MNPPPRISIVTVTLDRSSLRECCASIDAQTLKDWHHVVLGDGVRPREYPDARRSTLGFTSALGATEPAQNMPDGTPNPLLRWAIRHLDLAPYLCFLDDDNCYHPTFLSKMAAALDANPTAGIVLCPAENRRAMWHAIDGYPEYRRCDNSAFLVRTACAKAIGFPPARPDRECVQDYEFIRAVADRYGWVRVAEPLTVFGVADNTPPGRGGVRIVFSWALPVRGAELIRFGRRAEGLKALEEAVRFDPLDAWAWWNLGEGSLVDGCVARALESWSVYRSLLDRVASVPDDWSNYCYALAACLAGDNVVAADRLVVATEAAFRNDFTERILRAENELNLGIYSALCGSADDVAGHLRCAGREGLDGVVLEAAEWKRMVLAETLRCIGADEGQQSALEVLRLELGKYRDEQITIQCIDLAHSHSNVGLP